jgi:hypothetical protein
VYVGVGESVRRIVVKGEAVSRGHRNAR